jgi:hypothetical protein
VDSTRIRVLDPTAPAPADALGPGPDAGPLAGQRVGIRYDETWRSFEWVLDEWAAEFRAAGAEVDLWCAGNRIGEEGERTREELDGFATRVDIAVVGLGN